MIILIECLIILPDCLIILKECLIVLTKCLVTLTKCLIILTKCLIILTKCLIILPDRLVILGNHRDAWVYGAADPSSGTATMIEVAKAFGWLKKKGKRLALSYSNFYSTHTPVLP